MVYKLILLFFYKEPILFSSSIAENIAYGVKNTELELTDIVQSAKQANAYNFVSNFPDGFNTVVGERGQMLSGRSGTLLT